MSPEPGAVEHRSVVPLLLPIAAAAILLAFFWSYLTDDMYIYLRFARNLANGRGFSFNPGVPTYGFTSPLWVLALAGLARLGIALPLAVKALGALCTLATIPLFFGLARRIVPTRAGAWAATCAWAVNGLLIRWGLSGLETPLAVALVLAALGARAAEKDRPGLPVSGILFGLAALARPECLALLGIALVDAAWTDERRPRAVLALLAGAAAVLIPWLLFAEHAFGRVLPNTLFAKGAGVHAGGIARAAARIGPVYAAAAGFELLSGIIAIVLLLRRQSPSGARIPARTRAAAFLGSRPGPLLRAHFLPVAWTLACPALFLVGGASVVSRYLLPSVCLVVLYGFALTDALRISLADLRPRMRAAAPWLLCGAATALNLAILFGAALPSARAFTRGMEASLLPIGSWLREHTPDTAVVATSDVGAIGYVSDRRIFDLYGLVTPEMIPLERRLTANQVVETLAFGAIAHPDYLVDRYIAPDRFGLLELQESVVEPLFSRHMGALGMTRRGDFHYTVYRLHWDCLPAAR